MEKVDKSDKVDIGFDIHPPLKEMDELIKWDQFLQKVKQHYEHDPNFVEEDDHFVFKIGSRPILPKNGTFFRRFGSKCAGSCGAAEPYVSAIMEIAKTFFQRRVHFWNDDCYADLAPVYSPEEVKIAAEEFKDIQECSRHFSDKDDSIKFRS